MKTNRLMDMIKTNDLVIPSVLLNNYKNLNIDEKSLLFLAFLMSKENFVSFNPNLFSEKLSIPLEEIIKIVSDLSSKKLIDIVVKKENNKMKEYIDITNLYDKLITIVIDDEDKEIESQIYETVEKELGRTLSPIEYETIGGWLKSGIKEELIKEALKEAVLAGVHNLKYIDKILYEWSKKGYKEVSDIKKKNKKEEKIDLFEYDWLDDNE